MPHVKLHTDIEISIYNGAIESATPSVLRSHDLVGKFAIHFPVPAAAREAGHRATSIFSAKLWLFGTGSAPTTRSVVIHPITDGSWSATKAPSAWSSQSLTVPPSVGTWAVLDVTNHFRQATEPSSPNGWIADPIGSYGYYTNYASSYDSDPTNDPLLEILWAEEITFRDQTGRYISSTLDGSLDLGTLVAGTSSATQTLVVANNYPFSVSNVRVWVEGVDAPDSVEISRYTNPFVPEQVVLYPGTFQPGQDVGNLYLRVRVGELSTGSRGFQLKAKADPA